MRRKSFPVADGLAGKPRCPEPDLPGFRSVCKNEEVFRRQWGDRFLQIFPLVRGHDFPTGGGRNEEHLDDFLFGNDFEVDETIRIQTGCRDFQAAAGVRPVPANGGIGEQAGEVKSFEITGGFLALLWGHGKNGCREKWLERVLNRSNQYLSVESGRPVGDPNPTGVFPCLAGDRHHESLHLRPKIPGHDP